MKSKEKNKIPLPNNPYEIYSGEYNRLPLPKFVSRILGESEEDLKQKYQIEINVIPQEKKIEFQLQEREGEEENWKKNQDGDVRSV